MLFALPVSAAIELTPPDAQGGALVIEEEDVPLSELPEVVEIEDEEAPLSAAPETNAPHVALAMVGAGACMIVIAAAILVAGARHTYQANNLGKNKRYK